MTSKQTGEKPKAAGIAGYLLDTHTLLWFMTGSDRLSKSAASIISNGANPCWVSIASHWEICLKCSIGKLRLAAGWQQTIETVLADNRIAWLPIERVHCHGVVDLPFHHRDPFDRLLIAQAERENLTILSADTAFSQYDQIQATW